MDERDEQDLRAAAAPVVREACLIVEPPSLEEMPLDRRLSDAEIAALKKKAADFEAFVRTGDPPPSGQTP